MPLGPGSIAFTGFNSDGNDNLAFVALESIPSSTTILFTDNEWVNTTPDPSFNTGESAWSWTATSDVTAGTVVWIDNIGSGTLAANIGTATFTDTSNRGLAASDEIVYAYLGASATQPTTFLAAIANGALTNPSGTPAVILPTGLTAGTNALQFGNNIDIAEFNGARNNQSSFSGYAAVLNNPANWITQDGGGDQSADATAPDVPFSAATFSLQAGESEVGGITIFDEAPSLQGSATTPAASDALTLVRLGAYTPSTGNSEVVSFDPTTDQMYIVNATAKCIEIVRIDTSGALTGTGTIDLATTPDMGDLNSVAVKNGIVAVAYSSAVAGNPGHVAVYNAAGALQKTLDVGAGPDDLTFTPDGSKILVANEAEPASTTNNPAGSVSIIDVSGGPAAATVSNTIGFASLNGSEELLRAKGVSVLPGQSAADDIEPEYITVSPDGTRAYVTLQEVNAVAVIDLTDPAADRPVSILPLGGVDRSLAGNELDPSDQDSGINIVSAPVTSLLQPDAIASFSAGGETYFVTANEGDARVVFSDQLRVNSSAYTLDPTVFPNAALLEANASLGRLNVLTNRGDTDGDGDFDQIYTNGGRGISIFRQNADGTFTKVREVGGEFEKIIAARSDASTLFNQNQGSGFDTRSDDKGPEAEGVDVGEVGGRTYAFVGLERTGGVMVYDITDPAQASFVTYKAPEANDQGPEVLTFVSAADSPTGTALVLSANEISGTTTVYAALPQDDLMQIGEVQGTGHLSERVGEVLTLRGVVTAIDTNGSRGFYIQDPDGDGNAATSDGIFVFRPSGALPAVGRRVEVTGTVAEFIPSGAAVGSFSTTELTNVTNIVDLGTGPAITPTVIGGPGGVLPPTDSLIAGGQFFERLEGMLVTVKSAIAVGPTNDFGEIFTVVDNDNDPSNGVNATGRIDRGNLLLTPGAGDFGDTNTSGGDFNPERVQIDDDNGVLAGFASPDVNVGARLADVTGVLRYDFGNYEVIATQAYSVANPGTLVKESSTLTGTPTRLLVAAYNAENLDALDPAARFTAIGEEIVDRLNSPDIIALQEIQDNDGATNSSTTAANETLQKLVDAIAAAGGPAYAYIDNAFIGDDTNGGQPGGNIRNAFIYRVDRVDFVESSVATIGPDGSPVTSSYVDQQTNPDNPFFTSRPPLAATFVFNGEEVTVVNNHFTSKGGSAPLIGADQPPLNAGEVQRAAQAQAVNDYVDSLLAADANAKVLVMGDLNEFPWEEPMQVLKGTASVSNYDVPGTDPFNAVADYVPGGTAVLHDLQDELPANEQYDYVFEGNSQTLDHVLVTDGLRNGAELDIVRLNAEFADQTSDHEPLVASLNVPGEPHDLRAATFNASLNRNSAGQLVTDLLTGTHPQIENVAEIVQRVQPDILFVNEFDFGPAVDLDGVNDPTDLIRNNYFEVSQNGTAPIEFEHVFIAPSNTGVPSGFDLNNNGTVGGPDDALGFGFFPGQFGMAFFSKYDILEEGVRTFQNFLWKDMPGALLPDDPSTAAPNDWYSPEELAVVPLSSKSHWDIPILVNGEVIHVLMAHPTPPVFDGPEDRNGKRNHDEIRFWADYVTPGQGGYIYDDNGQTGGLGAGDRFIILGDYNADPLDGDSVAAAIDQLLDNPHVDDATPPTSDGGPDATARQGGINLTHLGNPAFDTADFADTAPGNLRVDYVLPSKSGLDHVGGGVYWKPNEDPLFRLIGDFTAVTPDFPTGFPASDHRLVYADLAITETDPPPTAGFTLQLLHFYGESGILGDATAPILGAMSDAFKTDYANTLTFAEGDTWIPGPWLVAGADPSLNAVPGIGSTALARPDVAIMNALGVNASALGNHEFDLGSPIVQGAIAASGTWPGAQFPFITANLDFSADSSLRGLADASLGGTATNDFAGKEASTIKGKIAPSAVVTVGGEKIGIVGATTFELLTKTSPNGTRPKDDGNPSTDDLQEVAAYVQGAVDALEAQGVNKIVMVDQLDTLERNKLLAPMLDGVDVMVAGGGHERQGDATDVPGAFNGHSPNFVETYPILSQDRAGDPTLIVTTDTEFTYLGRLVVEFDGKGVLDLTSLDPAINGAYAADEATLQRVYSSTQSAEAIVAGSATGTKVQAITDAITAVVVAKDSNKFGFSDVYLEGDRVFARNEETNLGNLSADANTRVARTALGEDAFIVSLKNGGGIRASIGTFDEDGTKIPNPIVPGADGNISQLDVENALRFDNRLMVFDTTPQGLLNLLNFGAGLPANNGGFPQVGGVRFSYDPDLPAGSRVQNVGLYDEDGSLVAKLVENGVVVPSAPATIQIVTLNFTANGGDGYPTKANGENFRFLLSDSTLSAPVDESLDFTAASVVPANAVGEQKAFEQYLEAVHGTPETAFDDADTPRSADLRIENLNFRSDAVFLQAAPEIAGDLAITVDDGDSVVVTTTDLTEADPDNDGAQLVYSVKATSHGDVLLNGNVITSFNQAELAAGDVSFRHDGSDTGSAGFTVVLADPGQLTSAPATVVATVAVSNDLPVFGSPTVFSVPENQASVGTVVATDPQGKAVGYALAGGDDASFFALDPVSGLLRFLTAPDFESLVDANGDNAYDLIVQAQDADGFIATQALQVGVTDVVEIGRTINGSTRNEVLTGDFGDDVISAGNGNDQASAGDGNDQVLAGNGNDSAFGGRGNDTLMGEGGNDELSGEDGNDRLDGGSGNDRLDGGRGDDELAGRDGNDQLFGGDGNDLLEGGGGNDRLEGGSGNDNLTGGTGNDEFVFGLGFGHDVIRDAGRGDKIVFTGGVFTSFQQVMAAASQVGADVHITLDAENEIVIQNIGVNTLASGDFMFSA